MLKIRPSQAEQLGRVHFVQQAAEHMRRNHRDFAASDPAVTRLFVAEAVNEAMDVYKLVQSRSVMTFVLVAWFLGPEFVAQYPESEVILYNPKAGEAERTDHLYRWAWKRLGEEQP